MSKKGTNPLRSLTVAQICPPPTLARLNQALKKGEVREFLSGLHELADFHGMTQLAEASGLDRSNLYSILTGTGEPRLSTLHAILNALGFRLSIENASAVSGEKKAKQKKPASKKK